IGKARRGSEHVAVRVNGTRRRLELGLRWIRMKRNVGRVGVFVHCAACTSQVFMRLRLLNLILNSFACNLVLMRGNSAFKNVASLRMATTNVPNASSFVSSGFAGPSTVAKKDSNALTTLSG